MRSLTLIPLAPMAALRLVLRSLRVLRFGMQHMFVKHLGCLCYALFFRRRAAGSQVSKPNSTRAAGAGGSSNTMLKLYTDDSPGLRV